LHDSYFQLDGSDRDGLVELANAESSLYTAFRDWESANRELLKLAQGEAEEVDATPPSGYQALKRLRGDEAVRLLHRTEWLVSAVMDASYALTERIVNATMKINSRSGNKLWNDITQKSELTRGSGSLVEQNLVGLFLGPNPTSDHMIFRDHLHSLVQWRNCRTHQAHLYANLQEPPLSVVYRDTLPYDNIAPTINFTDKELEGRLSALTVFLRWWIGRLAVEMKPGQQP
jgi:hypothetical protein